VEIYNNGNPARPGSSPGSGGISAVGFTRDAFFGAGCFPVVNTLESQVTSAYGQDRRLPNALGTNIYLTALHDHHERSFSACSGNTRANTETNPDFFRVSRREHLSRSTARRKSSRAWCNCYIEFLN
jgi:hypothetical protein